MVAVLLLSAVDHWTMGVLCGLRIGTCSESWKRTVCEHLRCSLDICTRTFGACKAIEQDIVKGAIYSGYAAFILVP